MKIVLAALWGVVEEIYLYNSSLLSVPTTADRNHFSTRGHESVVNWSITATVETRVDNLVSGDKKLNSLFFSYLKN